MTPHWIPALMPQGENESFPTYEDRLYKVFKRDFIDSHPIFDGLQVAVRRKQEKEDGKWAGFGHITSVEDHKIHTRVVDLCRCERIKFPRAVIDNYDICPMCLYQTCERPLVWKEPWRNRTRIHILVRPEKYYVILEPHINKGYCMLITAFYLNHQHSLENQLECYEKAKKDGRVIQE